MTEKFTKTDMERVALFQEMGYVSIGDEYKNASVSFRTVEPKKRQILSSGSKLKSGTQAGYFTESFPRILEGEAYSDQVKMRRDYRKKEAEKNIAKAFVPSSGEKLPSGVGSHFGTFSGPIPALSSQVKQGNAYKAPGKNFYTNPGKKGTGYGYSNVTIGHYNEYKSDNYNQYRENAKKENEAHKKASKGGAFRLNMAPKAYFDDNPFHSDRPQPPAKKIEGKNLEVKPFKPSSPGKRDGGMKAGTFDPYPSHSNDSYKTKTSSRGHAGSATQKSKSFMPPAGPKSAPVNSVLDQNIMRSVNVQNHRAVHSIMSY